MSWWIDVLLLIVDIETVTLFESVSLLCTSRAFSTHATTELK
jgi:hypothetical protein